MTESDHAFMKIILAHVGEGHAIPVNDALARMHDAGFRDLNERALRQLVHDLVMQDKLIAASEKGFYRPADMSEALSAADALEKVGHRYLARSRKVRTAADLVYGPQQHLPLGAVR